MKRYLSVLLWTLTLPFFAADWPQYLGPTRNGYAGPDEKAPAKLPAELKAIWRIKVGGGFSSPVVAGGRLLYFDENGPKEILHLLDAKTAKEIWQTPIADRFEDEWGGGPRSTPFFDGDRVYCQSCNGEFRCVNLADGKIRWGVNFEKDFGIKFLGAKSNEGTATRRGNNGSGIIDGDAVLVPVGSPNDASIVCFDKLTGKVLWKSGTDEAAYSSIEMATLAGRKQAVWFTADALCGFDRANGKELWRVPLKTNAKRHAMSPVIFGDQLVVNSHSIGMLCYKISAEGSGFKATQVWANKDAKINLSTPVLVDGFLYCQGASTDFICVDAGSGATKWQQAAFSRDVKKATSSIMVVGKKILALNYEGLLYLLEPNPEKYSEIGRSQVCGNNWNFPALSGGKLFVRDQRELICYDLTGQP
jgi:outer membrane protein assembly factor BamB